MKALAGQGVCAEYWLPADQMPKGQNRKCDVRNDEAQKIEDQNIDVQQKIDIGKLEILIPDS